MMRRNSQMMKKVYYLFLAFVPMSFFCQVGIGTTNPTGAFHIDGTSNNEAATSNKYIDDFVVLPNGNVGIGNNNPTVKLDIRGNANSSAIGLGSPSDADLSAATAKAGAIKYYYNSNTDKGLKYSNGASWITRPSADIKALVFASKGSTQTINTNSITNLTGWSESIDRTNSFDSNIFTAPRNGIYIATLNIALSDNAIANDSTIEVILSSNTTSGVPQFRCVYSFPGTGSGTVSNIVSGSCTGVFNLNSGNTITPQVFQNIGGGSSRSILNDASYNTLSIAEK